MEYKDIKVGETYNVRVKVEYKESDNEDGDIATVPVDKNGKKLTPDWAYYSPSDASAFSPITPENGIKNTVSAPKYDPCRKFRRGDKVRVVEYRGRSGCNVTKPGTVVTVDEDEEDSGWVWINEESVSGVAVATINAAYLELVTPVEEREPYFVMELKGAYGVYNTRFQPETEACHFYTDMHPHAKEAAQAECDRLNAEHRKEQK